MNRLPKIAIAVTALAFSTSVGVASAADISGAGATFPYPVYAKWAEAYKAKTDIGMNYQSIGSGGGIKQIKAGTVTFGASDRPLDEKDLMESGLVQWPQVMGGVVPAMNIEGVEPGQITLTGELISKIYQGEITSWNDPKIMALNNGVKLPDTAIAPVYRSDGSGTNFLWTDYLSKSDPSFKENIGSATSVQWPVGIGAKGNEGVANMVKQTQGAIGYVEYAYVKQNKMTFAKLVNQAGKVVEPSAESFQSAASNADWKGTPGYAVVLTNEPGDMSWPITGASFILMHKDAKNPESSRAALKFFDWAFEHGDKMADQLDYVPMPKKVVELIQETWKAEIKGANGEALYAAK